MSAAQTPREVLAHNAGARYSTRSRQTGRVVTVYHNVEAGMDDDEGAAPYSTVCEEHGTIFGHRTLSLARWHAADPIGWCAECAASKGDPSNEEGKR